MTNTEYPMTNVEVSDFVLGSSVLDIEYS